MDAFRMDVELLALIERAITAERMLTDAGFAIRDQRLAGMDRATAVLHEQVTRVPTDVQEAISHLKELTHQQFTAQKDAVARQAAATDMATSKAERGQLEALDKLGTLFRAELNNLAGQIGDVKQQVADNRLMLGSIQSTKSGQAQVINWIMAAIVTIGVLTTIGVTLGVGRSSTPTPVSNYFPPPTVVETTGTTGR